MHNLVCCSHAGPGTRLLTAGPTLLHSHCLSVCYREMQGLAAAQLEAQLASLPLLHSTDARRNCRAGAVSTEHFGAAVECLVQAFALGGVAFGAGSAGRQALVDTLGYQMQV